MGFDETEGFCDICRYGGVGGVVAYYVKAVSGMAAVACRPFGNVTRGAAFAQVLAGEQTAPAVGFGYEI